MSVLHLSVRESLWMGFYSPIALLWFLFPFFFFFGMCAHTLETEERREVRGATAPALQKGDGGFPFSWGLCCGFPHCNRVCVIFRALQLQQFPGWREGLVLGCIPPASPLPVAH